MGDVQKPRLTATVIQSPPHFRVGEPAGTLVRERLFPQDSPEFQSLLCREEKSRGGNNNSISLKGGIRLQEEQGI